MAEFVKLNPANGEVLRKYPCAESGEIAEIVGRSRVQAKVWAEVSSGRRARVLSRVADMVCESRDALATLISTETGKPYCQALEGDLLPAVSILRYYAENGPKILRERRMPLDKSLLMGRVHVRRRVPYGVCGVISPWNFPFAIPVSGVSAALMGGNTVVLKPSEMTPGVGMAVVDLFRMALAREGFSQEGVQVVLGMGETGALLAESDIDHMIFTGGGVTGAKVLAVMQSRGKSASLELGGSDPMIVLPGADLDAVTSYAVWGRLTNSGQACAALKRLLVPREVEAEVLGLLKRKMERLRVGPPWEVESQLGPLISERQRELIKAQVDDALGRGAELVTGGHGALPGEGYYYPPTVLGGVSLEARVMREEVFGPVLPVVGYGEVSEAIEIANGLPYGLGASVFGEGAEAVRVADRLEVGMVGINDLPTMGYALPVLPWSGWKGSGPGVSHGESGLEAVTREQVRTRNWMWEVPWMRKQFWHFGEKPDADFSRALVRSFASEGLRDKVSWRLWVALWRNRASRKL